MIEQVNRGDKEALRAFLQTYAQHILDRAAKRTASAQYAREAARLTMLSVSEAARGGKVPAEVEPWLDALTDESCARLAMPVRKGEGPKPAQPIQPAAQLAVAPAPPVQPAAQPVPVPQPVRPAPVSAQPVRPAQPLQQPTQRPQPMQQAQPAPQARPAPQAQPAQRPAAASQARPAPRQQPPRLFEEEEAPRRKREKEQGEAKAGMVLVIFLLVLVVLCLIWMLLVMLMSKGYLPVMDFGFANWFNTHVFQLF